MPSFGGPPERIWARGIRRFSSEIFPSAAPALAADPQTPSNARASRAKVGKRGRTACWRLPQAASPAEAFLERSIVGVLAIVIRDMFMRPLSPGERARAKRNEGSHILK